MQMKTKGFRGIAIKSLLHHIENTWYHQAMIEIMMEDNGLSRERAIKHYLNVLLVMQQNAQELFYKYEN